MSVGTGLSYSGTNEYGFFEMALSMISAGTDTEKVHAYIEDTCQALNFDYARLNPHLDKQYGIDEKSPEVLALLRKAGRTYVTQYANEQPKRFAKLVKLLRGAPG